MKIGFMLPAFGAMATHENMLAMAQLAEERGFESVWACEAQTITIELNGVSYRAGYPTTRSDTLGRCGCALTAS